MNKFQINNKSLVFSPEADKAVIKISKESGKK